VFGKKEYNLVVMPIHPPLGEIKVLSVLELLDFQTVGIHVLLVAVPRLVDLVDDHYGVAVD
jgi:hypothetical protein